jgi:hypothetical protein
MTDISRPPAPLKPSTRQGPVHIFSMFFTPELLAKRDSGFGLLWYVCNSQSREVIV